MQTSVEDLKNSAVKPAAGRASAPRLHSQRRVQGPGIIQIITLVLWLLCLVVGLLGWWLTQPPPAPTAPPKKAEPPPQAEVLKVDLEPMVLPQVVPQDQSQPPPPSDQPMPALPPLPEVAAYDPSIAFAQPIDGLVRLVSRGQANPGRISATPLPVIQRLVYGQGEGAQPEPDYPQEAVDAGEEGTVGVRLKVDSSGQVIDAQAISPCTWPLLNQAAVQAVRNTWHFSPGPPRIYDVSIAFQLNRL